MKPLNEDRDARRWAREFNEVIGMVSNGGHEPINEGLLIAWFANAMMCGEDTYRWRKEKEASQSEAVDEGCICKGNWRAIVKEYAPMIGKTFKRGDKAYRFFGLVHGDDDYYYGLVETGSKVVLSSCVGSLEMNGLEETDSQSAPEGKE